MPPHSGRAWKHAAWGGAYAAAVAAGILVVVGPSAIAWSDAFMAWPAPYPSAIPVGDHLQIAYFLWLWVHALATLSHLPWVDPFQFAASGMPSHQPFGWPLVLLSIPANALSGPVAAYNVLVLATFVGGAYATSALARALHCSRPAAAVAGFAFAFSPYRVVQAAVHINALLSPLLPLGLLAAEHALRQRGGRPQRAGWCCAAVIVSLAASGDMQIALYSSVMLAVYVILRLPGAPHGRVRILIAPATALLTGSALAAMLQYVYVLRPSVAGSGRSTVERAFFAPRLSDLARTNVVWWPELERYAYLGVVIVALALAGGVAGLATRGRRTITAGLAATVLATIVLAVAPNLPAVSQAWDVLPLAGYSRTPSRLLVVPVLALALLAAFAVDAVRRPPLRVALAALAMVAIVLDVPEGTFQRDPAGANPLAVVPAGATLLDLPPFDPGHFSGSVYAFLLTRSPGPRPGGYSPFVTPHARDAQATTVPLAATRVDPCRWRTVSHALGVRYVAVHLDLFGAHELQWQSDGVALVNALDVTPGFERLSREANVVVYRLDADRLRCADSGAS